MSDTLQSVLLVDDNENVRAGLRHYLENVAQVQVCEAADGLAAIKTAFEQKPTLIIMDLRMPQLNGIEAASAIHTVLPKTKIVMFTMFANAIGDHMAKMSGIDLIVSKSEGATGLMKALRPFWQAESSGDQHGSA